MQVFSECNAEKNNWLFHFGDPHVAPTDNFFPMIYIFCKKTSTIEL